MRQILFYVPGVQLPLFGFGLMLCVTIFVCPWLAARLAVKEGKPRAWIDDFAIWIFASGFVGARLFYMIQYRKDFDRPVAQFFQIWTGGLVIYGGLLGAIVGLLLFCWKRGIHPLWMLDIISPSMALGLSIGRIGCLLNGCCYGDLCLDRMGITFPSTGEHPSPPFVRMVARGHQTPLGFVVVPEDRRVLAVEPNADAERAGLKVGDEIIAIDGQATLKQATFNEAWRKLIEDKQGDFHIDDRPIELTVKRDAGETKVAFYPPRSLPVQPTQIFSSIDGLILCLFTLALLPHRTRNGEVIGWLATMYAISRFLIEYLRYDELPFGNGLTISQNGSVLLFIAGVALLIGTRMWPLPASGPRLESAVPTTPAGTG